MLFNACHIAICRCEWRLKHAIGWQEEFAAFRETAEQVAEAKDAELERVLGVNAGLRDHITVLQSQQVKHPSQHLCA